MIQTYQAAPDIDVLAAGIPIPGLGTVPVNAFVLQGREPVLVDTGAICHEQPFLEALRSVIDPKTLKWIWLTHPDPDHTGALHALLDENPTCRVVTTFLGVGILGLSRPLPMDRVYLLNPGQTMQLGDRTAVAVKPPTFDNPSTTGLFIKESRTLISSDCFGAVLPEPPQSAEDLSEDELHQGQLLWTSIDSPWLHNVDRGAYSRELERVRAFEPSQVLSSHLPAASGATLPRMLATLQAVPDADRFVGPDQAALEQMMMQMAAGG